MGARMLDRISIGQKSGRWTSLSREIRPRDGSGKSVIEARCDCGTERLVSSLRFLKGTSLSCGCLAREALLACRTKHLHSPASGSSRTYMSWLSMIGRCTRPSDPGYKRYGGAGITVCAEWIGDFCAFLRDMGERPSNHSIDRIDNSAGYSKGNCRWATAMTQAQNRKHNNKISMNGKTLTLRQWSDLTGVPVKLIRARFARGASAVRCLYPGRLRGNQHFQAAIEATKV